MRPSLFQSAAPSLVSRSRDFHPGRHLPSCLRRLPSCFLLVPTLPSRRQAPLASSCLPASTVGWTYQPRLVSCSYSKRSRESFQCQRLGLAGAGQPSQPNRGFGRHIYGGLARRAAPIPSFQLDFESVSAGRGFHHESMITWPMFSRPVHGPV